MDIHQLIRNRRAIYPEMFTGEPIQTAVLMQILEAANFAPTHKLTEPWRFRIIAGDKKVALGEILSAWYKDNTSAEVFSDMKFKKLHSRPIKSSYVVAICMQRDPKESLPEWEEIAAVAIAVQNIWLSGWDLGIGMYWSSPKAIYGNEIKDFLQLGEGERCLGFLYMGHKPTSLDLKAIRKPIEEKIKFI